MNPPLDSSHAPRIYIIGTDTSVGKTHVTCCILRTSIAAGLRALPFKPAQSRSPGEVSDASRLLRAAALPCTAEASMSPWSFHDPVAPGLAASPNAFIDTHTSPDPSVLQDVAARLHHWESMHDPQLTLIEGAGGLHVPMPGGVWQSEWIDALADAVVIVARRGLGTINHTLLTIDAVRTLRPPLLGVLLNETEPHTHEDPSVSHNAAVIARAREVPILTTLPYGATTVPPDALRVLLERASLATQR